MPQTPFGRIGRRNKKEEVQNTPWILRRGWTIVVQEDWQCALQEHIGRPSGWLSAWGSSCGFGLAIQFYTDVTYQHQNTRCSLTLNPHTVYLVSCFWSKNAAKTFRQRDSTSGMFATAVSETGTKRWTYLHLSVSETVYKCVELTAFVSHQFPRSTLYIWPRVPQDRQGVYKK